MFKKECVPSFTYHLSVAEEFPSPAGTCIVQRDDLQVYVHDDLEERYVGIAVNRQVYGCYREMDQYNADIVVIRKKANDLVYDTVFASLLALERHMEMGCYCIVPIYVIMMAEQFYFLHPVKPVKAHRHHCGKSTVLAAIRSMETKPICKE
ncbi:MAG: hypothetical protein LKE61_10755 [Erysipelotrichaceae bacterium]|nr:hypothetical protein [Erysipelotrichaceae bacterium]